MKILVAVDLSEATAKIVEEAKNMAEALSAKLWLIHAARPEPAFIGYDPGPQSVRDSVAKEFHVEHGKIHDLAESLRQAGLEVTALLVQGESVQAILHEAEKFDVDMIIIGSHGRGLMHQLILGSTSEGVLHKARCPVLVVPTHDRD